MKNDEKQVFLKKSNLLFTKFLLVVIFLSFQVYVDAQIMDSDKKYLVLGPWQQSSVASLNQYSDAAVAAGFTSLRIAVNWRNIEPTSGQYDFSYLDQTLNYAINQKGLSVFLLIWCKRGPDSFVPGTSAMKKEDGSESVQGGNLFSYNDTVTLAKAIEVCRRVAQRYKPLYNNNQILAYWPVFSGYAETEYYASAYYDYSSIAKVAFRIWLRKKYASISALNSAWKTNYASFEEINPSGAWNTEAKVSWYQFRSATLGNVINKTADAIHSIDPNLVIAAQFGSVWDHLVINRGTICFPELTKKCDLVIVDDNHLYNHPFSMDFLRRSLRGKCFGNEIDPPSWADDNTYYKQAKESFEHGARVLSVANWLPADVNQRQSLFKSIRSDFIDKVIPSQVPVSTISISATEVLFAGGATSYIANYNTLSNNGAKWVDINLIDDLTFSFNTPIAPTITSTVPITAAVGTLYTYTIATTGNPTPTLLVSGNPSWLKLNGNTLSATPPTTAGTITVTATNSQGSTNQTFIIRVPHHR